ncbi:ComEC/Rec2 family competence protein [Pseudalkalibacillus berkeleyi]|uniref:MBL fold metallo-hydrolase n=1 Tax=Pseudalkalibacillus berkeleyi TaxID=1069813 RepID=A0ABS9GWM8_9BACL|nr:ComEC/Rec2 family competence protein [Pseudalkalibacillus berkeleyi]MCF6136121.1 MBL fold metallo-hydrolase [Pseudalkalibacillus berkeleyi]
MRQLVLIFCILVLFPQPAEALWKTNLELHVIDVGQADCIYIETSNGKHILIDSGDEHDGKKVVSYLQKRGIERIDYLIATHPHHDHIGSMEDIFQSFEIERVYMPDIMYHTRYYKRMVQSIANSGVDQFVAKAGVKIKLARNISMEFVAPGKKRYKSLNDYSAVVRLQHGKNSFLLMADAGVISENELIKKLDDEKVDVLKVAHHGANTGTGHALLKKIKPDYAIISVGRKNKYGYPSKDVLNRLKSNDIQVYRTDKLGTIISKSDGKSVKFFTEVPQS